MKRFHAAITFCILIILALTGRLALEQRAVAVFAQEKIDEDRTTRRDLLVLILAYPGAITCVRRGDDGLIYVVMKSDDEIIYDDRMEKSFEEQLYSADLQDAMAMDYPLGSISTLMKDNTDPGRIRCYAFLHAVYGNTQHDIEQNLKNTPLVSGWYQVAVQASPPLETAMEQLSNLAQENPAAYGDVFPLNGTYNYRMIEGTGTLSPHAFGIAIDLCSRPGDYWRWATREQGQKRLDEYSPDVVRIMEDHGFIWGGKWAHFDFLHYEYRPELILKARYASDAQPWYAGFPNDAQTREYIEVIDAALE